MARCSECQKEISDPKTESCLLDVIQIDDVFYHRSTFHFQEPSGRCLHCGIVHGKVHHFGCDVEQCPKCGLQVIGCGCVNDDNVGLFFISAVEGEEVKKPRYPRAHPPMLCVQEIPKEQRSDSGDLYGVFDLNFSAFHRGLSGVVLSRATIFSASRLMEAVKWGIERAREKLTV
ncbi:hypothetical protein LCGC14_1206270 [marine sediment metagenome]|uniref:Uncharacterized protein n=1 Tax=marine sediment metagenome TaxID=412755 RepID=A0A0F9NXL8_9ZZZZ